MNMLFTPEAIIYLLLIVGTIAFMTIKIFIYTPVKKFWMRRIKGMSLYSSCKVLSVGGYKTDYKWFKSDDDALKSLKGDFIRCTYPEERNLKGYSS